MSLPEFPTPNPCLTREQAINMILVSISMEEISLSHVIEAESEKIKYALDYLRNQNCCSGIDQILEINKSATKLIETVLDTQMILKKKMESALSALPAPCPAPKPPCPAPKPPCPAPCPPHPAPKPEKGCSSVLYQHHKQFAVFVAKPSVWRCGSALSVCNQPACGTGMNPLPLRDTEILLPNCGRFLVNFNLELIPLSPSTAPVSVELRLTGSSQNLVTERSHASNCGNCVTVSGSILVETPANCQQSHLFIKLLSPGSVQVKSGRISIAEL